MNNNLDFVRDLISKKESDIGFRVPLTTRFSADLSPDIRLIVNGPLLYFYFFKNDSEFITYRLDFRFPTYGDGARVGSHWEDWKQSYCEFSTDFFNQFSDWQKTFYLKNLDIFQIKKHA